MRSGSHSHRSLTISAPIWSSLGAFWFGHPARMRPASAWPIALCAEPSCGAVTPLSAGGRFDQHHFLLPSGDGCGVSANEWPYAVVRPGVGVSDHQPYVLSVGII